MGNNRAMQYAEILSKLIKVETVSSRENQDIAKFLEFHKVLRETFPNFFNTVECEVLTAVFCSYGKAQTRL